jgi:hypothetical protein
MIQCVDYEDILFPYAKVFILNGKFGEGYIISPNDINTIKLINLKYPPLKSWFENGCIKLYSMEGQYYTEIPKLISWDVINKWGTDGAYINHWQK